MLSTEGLVFDEAAYSNLFKGNTKLMNQLLDTFNKIMLTPKEFNDIECDSDAVKIAISSTIQTWLDRIEEDEFDTDFIVYYLGVDNDEVLTFFKNYMIASELDDDNLGTEKLQCLFDKHLFATKDIVLCIKKNIEGIKEDSDDSAIFCKRIKEDGSVCGAKLIPEKLSFITKYIDKETGKEFGVAKCPKCEGYILENGEPSPYRDGNCAFCGTKISLNPANDKDLFVCPSCAERRKKGLDIKEAIKSIDSNKPIEVNSICDTIDKQIATCVEVLLEDYKHYYNSVDGIEGVVSDYIRNNIQDYVSVRLEEKISETSTKSKSLHYVPNKEQTQESGIKGKFLRFLHFATNDKNSNNINSDKVAGLINSLKVLGVKEVKACVRDEYHLDGDGFAKFYEKRLENAGEEEFIRILPGFHAPHIYGYFYDDNTLYKIADNEDLFKTNLRENIQRDLYEFIAHLKSVNTTIFELADKFTNTKVGYTSDLLNELQNMEDALFKAVKVYYKHLMTFIVVTRCADGMFSYDFVGEPSLVQSEEFRSKLRKFNSDFSGYLVTDAGSTLLNSAEGAAFNIVYNDIANGLVSSNIFTTVFITSITKYTGLPQFAYVPMLKLKKHGEPFSANKILLGRTLDGNPFYITGMFNGRGTVFHTLTGASRSGKGVTTLAMLGALFNDVNPQGDTNYILGYIDNKPETSLSIFKIEHKINMILRANGYANECVHFFALDTFLNYPCEGDGYANYMKLVALDKKNAEAGLYELGSDYSLVRTWMRRQANFPRETLLSSNDISFNPSAGLKLKLFSDLRKDWEAYFGVDIFAISGSSYQNISKLFNFLAYSKTVQLFTQFAYVSKLLAEKCGLDTNFNAFVLFADEIRSLKAAEESAAGLVLEIGSKLYKTKDKDPDVQSKINEANSKFAKFCKIFLGEFTTNVASHFAEAEVASATEFTKVLSDQATKQSANGCACNIIGTGQSLNRLNDSVKDAHTWINYFSTMLGGGVNIYGNWAGSEDRRDNCKKQFSDFIHEDEKFKKDPAVKNGYIHEYKDAAHKTSGFFVVKQGDSTKLVQTYLTLDKNEPIQTTIGENSVRNRVKQAYKDDKERMDALKRLNDYLFIDTTIRKDDSINAYNVVNSVTGEPFKNQSCVSEAEEIWKSVEESNEFYYILDIESGRAFSYDINRNRRGTPIGDILPPEIVKKSEGFVSNRREEVGFEGYLQCVGNNLDFNNVESVRAFAKAFGSSYRRLNAYFKSLPFVKAMGYELIEDYIYDMRPWTFFSDPKYFNGSDLQDDDINDLRNYNQTTSESFDDENNENFYSESGYGYDEDDLYDLPTDVRESVTMTFGYPCINSDEVSFMGKVESYHETISRIANKAKNCDTATKAEMLKQTRSIMPAVSKLFNEANPAVTDNCKDYAFRTIKGIIQHLIGVVQS